MLYIYGDLSMARFFFLCLIKKLFTLSKRIKFIRLWCWTKLTKTKNKITFRTDKQCVFSKIHFSLFDIFIQSHTIIVYNLYIFFFIIQKWVVDVFQHDNQLITVETLSHEKKKKTLTSKNNSIN